MNFVMKLRFFSVLILCCLANACAAYKVCEFNPGIQFSSSSDELIWQRDPLKYISFQDFYLNYKKDINHHFLVDVRSDQDFNWYHINSSYHFKGRSILVKSQLHEKSIVLIGDGSSYRNLESLYDSMLKRGFKTVKILDGGVLYFKNHTIESSFSPQLSQLRYLDFIFNEDLSHWLIQDYSGRNLGEEAFPVNRYFSTNRGGLKSIQSLVRNKGGLKKNVLLVVEDQGYEKLKEWQQILDNNVFIISSNAFNLSLSQRALRHKMQKRKQRTDGLDYACD